MTLSITAVCHYAECRNAEYCYAECRYTECCYAECRYAECPGSQYNDIQHNDAELAVQNICIRPIATVLL